MRNKKNQNQKQLTLVLISKCEYYFNSSKKIINTHITYVKHITKCKSNIDNIYVYDIDYHFVITSKKTQNSQDMKFALFPNYILTTRLLNGKEADKVSHNNTDLVTRWNSVYDACSRVICFH